MPTMWKSYAYEDGKDWGNRYLFKRQFHDDFRVPPIPAGELGGRFLDRIGYCPAPPAGDAVGALADAGKAVAAEMAAGRKTVVHGKGTCRLAYLGQFDDSWAAPAECHPSLQQQLDHYAKTTPDGALVLKLGYAGLNRKEADLWRAKKQRVIFMSGDGG